MMVNFPRKRKTEDISFKVPERLNLKYSSIFIIPLRRIIKTAGLLFILLVFTGLVQAPQNSSTIIAQSEGTSSVTTEEERLRLEEELNDLEKQIAEHQKTVAEYQKQGKTLSNEIKSLNAKIQQLNLQIKVINLNLEKLNAEITTTQKQINTTEKNIDNHKTALGNAIRNLYEADSQSLIEVLLANDRLSDFFGNLNNIKLVQENLRAALTEIIKLRQDLLEQKQELALEKEDVENLKSYRESQKKSVSTTQTEKNQLLKVTKGKESEYQKLLKQTQETASQIRSRIFRLLGGGELTFEEAYRYARLAEGATGVRAAFVLAILQQESLLGKNVGRCSYTTAMHPTRDIPIFLALLAKLSIDSNSLVAQVSCANRDGTYGGAMGPAQFIPSTWALYGGWEKDGSSWRYNPDKDKIGAISGQKPSNPWTNADAFVATALYLKDSLNSSACRNYSTALPGEERMLLERCAAAQYYAGRRWYNYRFVYGDPVVTKADKFQKDIDILNANGA